MTMSKREKILIALLLAGCLACTGSAQADVDYNSRQTNSDENASYTDKTFTADSSPAGGLGGALYNEGTITSISGTLSDDKSSSTSSFTNCKVTNGSDDALGGAIYNKGIINSISGTIFSGNSAASTAGGSYGSFGGAIYNDTGAEIGIISGTYFYNNTADIGGAIENEGGTITKISDSVFSSNKTTEGLEDSAGGAIDNFATGSGGDSDTSATIGTIENCTFTTNESNEGGAINNFASADRSATANASATITLIDNCTFDGNIADDSGGAIQNYGNGTTSGGYMAVATIETIKDSKFTSNKANEGGAIYNSGDPSGGDGGIINSITGSSFVGNQAQSDESPSSLSGRGGAIYNNNGGKISSIYDCTFETNTAAYFGGAIYNHEGGTLTKIEETTFTKNEATTGAGGAIFNEENATMGDITNSKFDGNTATGSHTIDSAEKGGGGAIFNDEKATLGTISGSTFTGNKAIVTEGKFVDVGGRGGAIFNADSATITSIYNCTFDGNIASLYGGAIYNNTNGKINSIEKSTFKNNEAQAGNGGAIENGWEGSTIGSISGCTFEGNVAKVNNVDEGRDTVTGFGAAIYNEGTIGTVDESTNTISGGISSCVFKDNVAGAAGGAIYNRYNEEANEGSGSYAQMGDITNCTFDGNSAGTSGGAIYNAVGCSIGTISGSSFDGNGTGTDSSGTTVSTANGGAIYNEGTITAIKNTSFTNNTATEKGGAIYTATDLTIAAENGGSVVFKGNTANSESNAIYMAKDSTGAATKLLFSLSNGGSIYLYDGIQGEGEYSVDISGDGVKNIFYLLNDVNAVSDVSPASITPYAASEDTTNNADLSVGGVTLSTVNEEIHTYMVNKFSVTDDFNMEADVDLQNQEMDRFVTTAEDGYDTTGGGLNVSALYLLNDATDDQVAVYFAESGLMDSVSSSVTTAEADVYRYNVYYVCKDGDGNISYDGSTVGEATDNSLISSSDDEGGYFVFRKAGNTPTVMASSISQMAVWGAMNMMFNYNFEHSDYFMKLPSDVRLAKIEESRAKKSASEIKESDATKPSYYNQNEMTYHGAWFKSFYANENVSYGGGWDSRDKYYGALLGFDSDLHDLGDDWAHLFTGYVGSIGIRQEYSGGHIKQHGGLVGVTESFYKKNFYTAWTAAAGLTKAHEHTKNGHESSRNNAWGIAAKFGYNFEFADGKFALLPTFTASYSTVNPDGYTTAAGVWISGSGVRAWQLNPNVKFIMNLENGVQPYLTLGEVWTVGEDSSMRANGDKLEDLELHAYTEYGIGVQKRWAYDKDAYFQILGHSDGRDGVLVNAGVRWTF